MIQRGCRINLWIKINQFHPHLSIFQSNDKIELVSIQKCSKYWKWFYLQLNAVRGWWLLMQLKEKVVSGKVQTPSQPNSRTLSLSLFQMLTSVITFSAKLSHSFTFAFSNNSNAHFTDHFLSKTLALFHFLFFKHFKCSHHWFLFQPNSRTLSILLFQIFKMITSLITFFSQILSLSLFKIFQMLTSLIAFM